MTESGRPRRVTLLAALTTLVAVGLLFPQLGGAKRLGGEVRPRSLHLSLGANATRGYDVSIETLGHHRVVLTAEKGGAFASYTVRGTVTRRRIKADFGRFGHVSVRFHGKRKPFALLPGSQRKVPGRHRVCRGRSPEREVGRFRGTIDFAGQRAFTKLAIGRLQGEVRRSYRQVCRGGFRVRELSRATRAGFGITLLTARQRHGKTVTRFDAIGIEPPRFAGIKSSELPAIVSASRKETVGRVRVSRSFFLSAQAGAVTFSRRGVKPAIARVDLPRPFGGHALYRGAKGSSPASWTGPLDVRLPGSGPLPLTGPGFKVFLCRVGSAPGNPCLRRAEASVAAQGSGSHSHPLAEARLSSLR
jgi:hypothetical protein